MAKASEGKNGSNSRNSRAKKTTTVGSAAKGPQPVPPVASAAFKAHENGDMEEQIRQRAYELYEQEGRQDGRDQEYWLRAEAEVRGRRSA